MPIRYELRTIKDIFDKVPSDRWETLFAELLPTFQQAEALRDLGRIASEMVGVDPDTVVFGEQVVWVDDDKGELTSTVSAADQPDIGFSVKSKL